MDDSQNPVAAATPGPIPVANPARVRPAGDPGGYGPIAGVTVGNQTGDNAARADDFARASRTSAISGQVLAAVLLLLALAPPLVLCAVDGLTGRGALIPHSPLWAWGSGTIALFLTLRLVVAALMRRGAGLVLPLVLVVVFLLTPAATLLSLQVVARHPITLTIGVAGIVLYAISTIALLMISLTVARYEQPS